MSDNKSKDKKNNKGTFFTFTDFNINNIKFGYSEQFEEYSDMIRGIAWATETCPKTSREHNQGYIQVFSQTRFTALAKMLRSHCHFEIVHGTLKQNEDYCSKEGKLTKLGYFATKGYRTDWHNIKEDIRNGSSMYDIMENYTSHFGQYSNGISKIKTEIDNKVLSTKIRDIKTTIIYGDTGCGKTTAIMNQFDLNDVYVLQNPDKDNKNWNGYNGQRVLVVDDFYGWIRPAEMLRLLDGKPYRVRKLNGFSWAQFDKVFITSNCDPLDWWANGDIPEKVLQAVWRRCGNCCLEVLSRGNTEALDFKKWKLGNYVKPKNFLTFSDIEKCMNQEAQTKCVIPDTDSELDSSDEEKVDEKIAQPSVPEPQGSFSTKCNGISRLDNSVDNVQVSVIDVSTYKDEKVKKDSLDKYINVAPFGVIKVDG